MAYDIKLCLYWVAALFAVIDGGVRLAPYGLLLNLIFAVSAAYAWIIIGRRIFNKPEGL